MLDQLIIGSYKSQDDFDASVSKRVVGTPKKKEIKETVPFANVTYDFSKMNGEFYWEERTLEYELEVIAESFVELEEKKIALSNWLMNVQDAELIDPYIADYFFRATYSDLTFSDEESMDKTVAKVKFTAYPYKIAKKLTEYTFDITANQSREVVVLNASSHRITPTFNASASVTVSKGSSSYSMPSGTTTDDSFKLDEGVNALTLQAASNCTITITFFCEVL